MRSRCAGWILVLALLGGPVLVHAQEEGISQRKQEKTLAHKKKEDKKAAKKKEKTDREQHLGIQDKATRRRIKQHTRRADRGGSGAHRDGFFQRMFGHKH
ncbi:MAG TPA: hypothetical protein VKG92_09755 [Flavobacteriales bacterium]|nr:hypothetical protein [Flavobacteriales bacterium]